MRVSLEWMIVVGYEKTALMSPFGDIFETPR